MTASGRTQSWATANMYRLISAPGRNNGCIRPQRITRFDFQQAEGNGQVTTYRLTYFDIDGGRAEPIRIAFHAAGIDFDDNRISFAEFQELRQRTRFHCVPVLEIDGAEVTQSNALSRYVGKMADLYPEDDLPPCQFR